MDSGFKANYSMSVTNQHCKSLPQPGGAVVIPHCKAVLGSNLPVFSPASPHSPQIHLEFPLFYTVQYCMRLYAIISSRLPDIPGYVTALTLDEVEVAYYDSSLGELQSRQDWVRKFIENEPHEWETLVRGSRNYEQQLRVDTEGFKQQSSQPEGMYLMQKKYLLLDRSIFSIIPCSHFYHLSFVVRTS